MTNTKFRKRALLSSVAMLLVALVALGSATFAWFSANNQVTATNFSVTAATSDGLQIAKVDLSGTAPLASAYSTSIEINDSNDAVWDPVSPIIDSSTKLATFYNATAASATGYGMNSDKASSTNSGFYAKDIFLKSGKANPTKITVAASITNTYSYARIYLINATSGTVYRLSSGNDTNLALKQDTVDTTKAVEDTATTVSSAASADILAADLPALATGERFHIYCFFEGQDEDCKDVQSGSNFTASLTFTLS